MNFNSIYDVVQKKLISTYLSIWIQIIEKIILNSKNAYTFRDDDSVECLKLITLYR